MQQPVLSVRSVLIGFGALSVLIAAGLASFGLFAMQLQKTALERVILLEQALHNHSTADAFMDSLRTDVLRALQAAAGANKEGETAIRAEFQHHIETVTDAIADNLKLLLAPELRGRYRAIAEFNAAFATTAHEAVDLAFSDPAAGSRNYEHFRQQFSSLEDMMDSLRDELNATVLKARARGAATATVSRGVIFGSALIGAVVLSLITGIAVRIVRRITADLASSRAQAQHLSLHDALTGLPNRVMFGDRVAQAMSQAHRHGHSAAMLCLDLDRFKQINDTLGHPVGDALLQSVAERLRMNVREGDTVARLGGDEFAVLQTPIALADEARSLAQRLVDVLAEPYQLSGHQVMISASIGMALAPIDTLEANELLQKADLALYRAKSEGRNTFCFFESGMDAKLQARRQLESDLRDAIAAERLELHYQPLIDLACGTVAGFEALVRWPHPQRGMIPPGDFIPLAEETGLIVPLGAWVLRQACIDAATWPVQVSVAVNISAAQFKGSGLLTAVSEALIGSGLSPERLEVEITETALLTDADTTLATLRNLRSTGVSIAMDDFGTGYSSLGYLRSFPFDKIKIDQCFIRDIETSKDCKAIVRAVTGLCVSLGIATTAEGVETLAQLDQLRTEGCDLVQGYYFSRPVPGQEVARLLSSTWAQSLMNRPELVAAELTPVHESVLV